MKIKKNLVIGSVITAMAAFCGTSQAQSVSGWSISNYGNGGSWSITEGSAGDYTIGGSALTSGAGWGAEFTPVNLSVGESIDLTGQFTITGSVGGSGPFRLGLFNDNGNLTGSSSWTGYLFAPSTGGSIAGGAGEFSGHDGTGGYGSTYSGAYGFGTGNANAGTLANDTYDFSVKLSQLSASEVQMDYSIVGQSASPYTETGVALDNGGAATANTSYNAVGFYLANNGTTATSLAFTGVQITTAPVPEPATMSLLGGGLLGLLLIRRNRIKTKTT